MTTSRNSRAPAGARIIAVAAALTFSAGAAPAAPERRAADPIAPIVFFWSSPSRSDARARPHLVAAIQQAASATRSRVLDLSPLAPSPPDTASRVSRAVAAYDAMRFADAIFELDQAALAAAENGAWGLSRDALVDLFLYRGLCKTESGDQAGAWNDFVRAATLDPARVLDPARFRPSAVKSFERAVHEVSSRAPVALTVVAPIGSRISIDGRSSGRDRLGEWLLPGEHYVWVERPAAPPFARVVALASPVTLTVPDDAAQVPDDAELRQRAARLGAGALLVITLSHQGGLAVVELRSLERRGGVLRGAVRLGPSPEADAHDLRPAVASALREIVAAGPRAGLTAGALEPRVEEPRWYKKPWVWVALGAAGALLAASPFLLDSSDASPSFYGSADTGGLAR